MAAYLKKVESFWEKMTFWQIFARDIFPCWILFFCDKYISYYYCIRTVNILSTTCHTTCDENHVIYWSFKRRANVYKNYIVKYPSLECDTKILPLLVRLLSRTQVVNKVPRVFFALIGRACRQPISLQQIWCHLLETRFYKNNHFHRVLPTLTLSFLMPLTHLTRTTRIHILHVTIYHKKVFFCLSYIYPISLKNILCQLLS